MVERELYQRPSPCQRPWTRLSPTAKMMAHWRIESNLRGAPSPWYFLRSGSKWCHSANRSGPKSQCSLCSRESRTRGGKSKFL